MSFKKTLLAIAALSFVGVAGAATATSSFNVKLTVNGTCAIKVAPIDIDLGTVLAGDAVTPASTVINVNCSKGTAFTVGLTPSNSSTVGAGAMAGPAPSTPIAYQLHQTTAAGAVWGNVTGAGANVWCWPWHGCTTNCAVHSLRFSCCWGDRRCDLGRLHRPGHCDRHLLI